MTQPLRHVNPGEPFKPQAAEWNRFVDTARWADQQRNIMRPGELFAAANEQVVGVLTSSMTAASPDGLTGATNFTFKIWRPDPSDSSSPQQFIQDADDTTGVNRSKRTATSGDFCVFMFMNGEWNAIPIDCTLV